jgi:hypothetical protein
MARFTVSDNTALRLIMAALEPDDFLWRYTLAEIHEGGAERIDAVIKDLCRLAIGTMVTSDSGGKIDEYLQHWTAGQLDADALHDDEDQP